VRNFIKLVYELVYVFGLVCQQEIIESRREGSGPRGAVSWQSRPRSAGGPRTGAWGRDSSLPP